MVDSNARNGPPLARLADVDRLRRRGDRLVAPARRLVAECGRVARVEQGGVQAADEPDCPVADREHGWMNAVQPAGVRQTGNRRVGLAQLQ
jgi:hypothetical protein